MLLDFMTEIRNETIVHCRSFTHESDFVAFQEPFEGFTAADNRESFLQVHAPSGSFWRERRQSRQ